METININLPDKSDKVLILLHFSYGYLNENDSEFGLAHLVEHYIIEVLEKHYEPYDIDGTINDNDFTIFLNLKKEQLNKLENPIDDILNTIKESAKNIDPKILKNEKARIKIELMEKYSEVLSEIDYSIENKIISTPKRLKRNRADQLKNIQKFRPKDIQKGISKILRHQNVAFVGYKNNKGKNTKLPSKLSNNHYKINLTTRKKQKFESQNIILKETSNFALAFPLKNLYSNISEYFAFKFILNEIYDNFFKKIKGMGIYKVEYQYDFTFQGGYIWYFANSYNKINPDNTTVGFHQAVTDFLADKDLEKNIENFKKLLITDLKNDWRNFYDKFDWITSSVMNKGNIDGLDEIVSAIKKIDSHAVKKLTKQTFVEKNCLILTDK